MITLAFDPTNFLDNDPENEKIKDIPKDCLKNKKVCKLKLIMKTILMAYRISFGIK